MARPWQTKNREERLRRLRAKFQPQHPFLLPTSPHSAGDNAELFEDQRGEILPPRWRRHFSRDFEENVLRRWFEATAVAFFTQYGDKWVASATKMSVLRMAPAQLEEIVKKTAKAHGLEGSIETLTLGFRNFIRSQGPEDINLKWHYGRAMFAARLMAADLAADPISFKEFF